MQKSSQNVIINKRTPSFFTGRIGCPSCCPWGHIDWLCDIAFIWHLSVFMMWTCSSVSNVSVLIPCVLLTYRWRKCFRRPLLQWLIMVIWRWKVDSSWLISLPSSAVCLPTQWVINMMAVPSCRVKMLQYDCMYMFYEHVLLKYPTGSQANNNRHFKHSLAYNCHKGACSDETNHIKITQLNICSIQVLYHHHHHHQNC